MSPNRRNFLAMMAGGAMSLASVAPVVAAEPELTEWEELAALRSAIQEIQQRHGPWYSDDRTVANLYMASNMIGWAMMEQCPHDESLRRIERDTIRPEDWYEVCDGCQSRLLHVARFESRAGESAAAD